MLHSLSPYYDSYFCNYCTSTIQDWPGLSTQRSAPALSLCPRRALRGCMLLLDLFEDARGHELTVVVHRVGTTGAEVSRAIRRELGPAKDEHRLEAERLMQAGGTHQDRFCILPEDGADAPIPRERHELLQTDGVSLASEEEPAGLAVIALFEVTVESAVDVAERLILEADRDREEP